jgi:arsenate reductase
MVETDCKYMKIYHNPRCRKSRETLEIIRNHGIEPEIIEYLANPLTAKELQSIIEMLNLKPLEIIRTNEPEFKDHFKGKALSDAEWIDAMVAFPKLMERPIVVKGGQAIIGRPPTNVEKLLG